MTKIGQVRPLPVKVSFCDGQIVCHFLRTPQPNDTLVLAIPGGPGLSSLYLDFFMGLVAERLGVNVATMDLPNHGDSHLKNQSTPIFYPQCLDFVTKAVEEISHRVRSLILFGQSFGARLAFDLSASLETPPHATLLTGFPYTFQISTALATRLDALPLETEVGAFAAQKRSDNWRKILPLYTVKPLASEIFEALATRAMVPNEYQMLEGAPQIQSIAKTVSPKHHMTIVEAVLDPVVPDNNWEVLRSLLPHASFVEIINVGHFSMVERPQEVLSVISKAIEYPEKRPL